MTKFSTADVQKIVDLLFSPIEENLLVAFEIIKGSDHLIDHLRIPLVLLFRMHENPKIRHISGDLLKTANLWNTEDIGYQFLGVLNFKGANASTKRKFVQPYRVRFDKERSTYEFFIKQHKQFTKIYERLIQELGYPWTF